MARLDAVALNADWSTALNTSNGGMLDLAQFHYQRGVLEYLAPRDLAAITAVFSARGLLLRLPVAGIAVGRNVCLTALLAWMARSGAQLAGLTLHAREDHNLVERLREPPLRGLRRLQLQVGDAMQLAPLAALEVLEELRLEGTCRSEQHAPQR